MPKGKEQAGAAAQGQGAAVFTPPDASAHVKYQQLKAIFSKAFKKAGVRPAEEGLWDFWGLLCRYEGKQSINTIADLLLLYLSRHEEFVSIAYTLVILFLQRTMITANLHQPIFLSLISQQAIDDHTFKCLWLLSTIFGAFNRFVRPELAQVPKECLATESVYATWAPLHWHPRSIEIACRALLSTEESDLQKPAIQYILLFSEAGALPKPFPQVDFHAVLEDPRCMNAIFSLLHHAEHTAFSLRILGVLFGRAEPSSHSASFPGSLRKLLSMGAAHPLASALNNLSNKIEQQKLLLTWGGWLLPQQQRQWQQRLLEDALQSLTTLLLIVKRASSWDCTVEHALPRGCGLAVGCACEAAWPDDLLEAHLCAVIKVLKTKPSPGVIGRPVSSFASDLNQYPVNSRPMAARILKRHPTALPDLLQFLSSSVAAIPSAKGEAAAACTAVLECISHIFDVTEGGTNLQEQLPLQQLGSSAAKAFVHAIKVLQLQQRAVGSGGIITETFNYRGLLSVSTDLLLRLPEMLGLEVMGSILKSETDGKFGAPTKLGALFRQWLDDAKVDALMQMLKHAKEGVSSASGAAGTGASGGDVGVGGSSCTLPRWPEAMSALREVWPEGGQSSTTGAEMLGKVIDAAKLLSVSLRGDAGGSGAGVDDGVGSRASAARTSCTDAGMPQKTNSASTSGNESSSSANRGGTGKPHRVCASCGRVGKLKACGRCEAVWFCGVECQLREWPSHKMVCVPKGAAVP